MANDVRIIVGIEQFEAGAVLTGQRAKTADASAAPTYTFEPPLYVAHTNSPRSLCLFELRRLVAKLYSRGRWAEWPTPCSRPVIATLTEPMIIWKVAAQLPATH